MKRIILVVLLVIIIAFGIATYDSILNKNEMAASPDAKEENIQVGLLLNMVVLVQSK